LADETPSDPPDERRLRLENSLLLEIVDQDPVHLTQDELVLLKEHPSAGTDRIAILDALHELKRSGLIRFNGEVIEPTYAALRGVEIFECP
jgi:hypothetical protein